MNINRAGKQQKAYWDSQERLHDALADEMTYQELMAAERGHAAGWIAGVAWLKRQKPPPTNKRNEGI